MANKFVSFFEKVGAALKKLFTNPTLEKQINSVISYAAPLVETILTLTAGEPIEQFVAGVISTVQSDLATAYAVVQGATVTAGSSVATTVTAALNSVKTNLTGLLEDADVKNSTKLADITATVNLIVSETDAVLANLPGATPPAA